MLDARFVPLPSWPLKPTISRKEGSFRAHYNATLDLLEKELAYLRARDIVIQAGFDKSQLRNDGWPKVGVRPLHPGVIVTFEGKTGPLSFPCDNFTEYEVNLRAIGLSLEALRAVDRYGVTRSAEQYKGWAQITAPGATTHFGNAEEAADFIILQSGVSYGRRQVLENSEVRREAYRNAARHLHPDRGGNSDQFTLLQEALAIVEAK